ncbi:MAG: GNAT family N-acetyltransferase [Imperialibacter sp.]|uniref:GNAT family N-acetyltransferase n=1 Tax=Imperialibacter sp. TaxID=2038411 RepID=UPI0032EEA85C
METEPSLLVEVKTPDLQEFKEVTNAPQVLFDILPDDWQECIVPFWGRYAATARVFCLLSDEKVLGGGIVFSTIPPDTLDEKMAQELFDKGLLYIGFLWISEEMRGCNLGSKWIEQARKVFDDKQFWLTIDDYRLTSFYKRNGFQLIGEVSKDESVEWVMADTDV